MSKISRFMIKAATLAKNVVGGQGKVSTLEGGGSFADYASVCCTVYGSTLMNHIATQAICAASLPPRSICETVFVLIKRTHGDAMLRELSIENFVNSS